jgi:uncharacterized NAD(P)/FAD-binding protein YdhS/trehalose-6-phosphate synthase
MQSSSRRQYDVAIIGAGFSGSMVAIHLTRISPRLQVLVTDKTGVFGPGVAYSTLDLHHLLNVPAGKMSAFSDEPDHFLQWLQAQSEGRNILVSNDAFVPRRFYGEYVRQLFEQARQSNRGLTTLEIEIVDIHPQRNRLVLHGTSGEEFLASKVVLALGNFGPGDPPAKDRRFHQNPRYFNMPWSPTMLDQLSGRDDILILGSGLTALDLLISLNETKRQGQIHVVSRHGLFPQAHQPYLAQPGWFNNRDFPQTIRRLLRVIRNDIRIAAAEAMDWRAVIDALRPHTQQIWRSLNIDERRRFMRHVRSFWESHRHRVAPAVLSIKDSMLQRGQVVFHKARVESIIESDNGFEVALFDRATRRETKLLPGYVINCTGPECNYYKLKDPLVLNLLARGLIHPDPLFLGLAAAPNGAVLNYLGQPSDHIFTLGSVKKGMLFETTAVPELRVQASELAIELMRPLQAASKSIKHKRATSKGKLILISNRGPNDFVWQDQKWSPRQSSGGLVSMIDPLARQPDVTWFCCVSEPLSANEERAKLFTTAADQTDPEHHVVPVPLPAKVYQAYYGGISNEVLWMLQHHLVGQFGYSSLDAARHRAWTEGYLEANRRMVVAIRASGVTPRAFLIQDYHFYPLPALLRKVFPDTPILHFTHIPFPDAATLKLIPQHWRDTILQGLLGADVVGMQTLWDARPFLGCCEELLGAKVDYQKGTVLAPDGRTVQVSVFPASTDPAEVRRTLNSESLAPARQKLAPFLNKSTIIRVDRLDPSKNQIIGFQAFGRLLELRPDLHGTVRFLAFLVPSRTDLTVYCDYREAVYQTISEVNQRFAPECGFEPIQVFYTNDRGQALVAMESCDVLLANSREDGMNLVVKEWGIASQRPGVAIISETAGVASEIGANALLVSPLDVEGTAHAMAWALDMPMAEREARLARLREKIESWTAAHWLAAQLDALKVQKPQSADPHLRQQRSDRQEHLRFS